MTTFRPITGAARYWPCNIFCYYMAYLCNMYLWISIVCSDCAAVTSLLSVIWTCNIAVSSNRCGFVNAITKAERLPLDKTNYGHFAYGTLRLLNSSPTVWSVCLFGLVRRTVQALGELSTVSSRQSVQ